MKYISKIEYKWAVVVNGEVVETWWNRGSAIKDAQKRGGKAKRFEITNIEVLEETKEL